MLYLMFYGDYMAMIWCYTGPSGVGKSSYVDNNCKLLYRIKTTTTREPRDDDGVGTYEYISYDEFFDIMEKDAFFITNNAYGDMCGIRKEEIGKCKYSVVILDVHGTIKLKEKLESSDARSQEDNESIKMMSIFVLPKYVNDVDHLHSLVAKRLIDRNAHSEQDIINRLKELPIEYNMRKKFDEVIYISNIGNKDDIKNISNK